MLTKLMPTARVKVLAFLLLNAGEEFYMREIARRVGVALRAIQRELEILEGIALVRRVRRGHHVFARVETDHPLFGDLRNLFLKCEGLATPVRDVLVRVDGVEAAAVYGSVAAGTDTGRSDIDLLIVGAPDAVALHEAASQVEDRLGRPINYTVLTRNELAKRRRAGDPFLTRVLDGPLLPVLGDVHAV